MAHPGTEQSHGTGTCAPPRARALLLVMCAGMFLVLLDVTAVNVALPSIGTGLQAGVAGMQWVVDAYAVAIASLLLAAGTIGDRLGHRRVVLAGVALFGLASAACAGAPSLAVLLVARFIQGVGAAQLLPGTMALIAEAYPGRAAQARALGTWAAVSSLALPAGPVIGGALVTLSSWRLVFAVNVPITLAILVAIPRLVAPGAASTRRAVDCIGTVSLALLLCGAVFTVMAVGRHGTPGTIVPALGAVAAGLAGLALVRARRRRSKSAPEPVVPLALLRHAEFAAPNVIALTMNLVFNGTLFVTTLYLQQTRGLSAASAGLAVLPMAVPLVVLAPVSGRLTARFGPRLAVASGAVLGIAGGLLLLLVGLDRPAAWILLPIAVTGLGGGLITASVVAAAVQSVSPQRSGLATGMSNTARQVGTAGGVAVFGTMAGSPLAADAFVHRLHVIGILSAVLWLAALALTGRLRHDQFTRVSAASSTSPGAPR